MPCGDQITGNGATITFASGFMARYRQIGGLREFHELIDETDLKQTYECQFAAALRRNDPVEIELFWNPDWTLEGASETSGPPLGANNQSVVLTYPKIGTQTTGAIRTAEAVVSEVTSPVLENETELSGTFMIKYQEKPQITVAVSP